MNFGFIKCFPLTHSVLSVHIIVTFFVCWLLPSQQSEGVTWGRLRDEKQSILMVTGKHPQGVGGKKHISSLRKMQPKWDPEKMASYGFSNHCTSVPVALIQKFQTWFPAPMTDVKKPALLNLQPPGDRCARSGRSRGKGSFCQTREVRLTPAGSTRQALKGVNWGANSG